jgi:hypothetical protein
MYSQISPSQVDWARATTPSQDRRFGLRRWIRSGETGPRRPENPPWPSASPYEPVTSPSWRSRRRGQPVDRGGCAEGGCPPADHAIRVGELRAPRDVAERLTLRAIREGRDIEALVTEILEAAARRR